MRQIAIDRAGFRSVIAEHRPNRRLLLRIGNGYQVAVCRRFGKTIKRRYHKNLTCQE